MLKKIVSFGYKYRVPQEKPGTVVIDLRKMFINPYHVNGLKDLDGRDNRVQEYVKRTPNYQALYLHLAQKVTVPGIDVAYVGCVGGCHRSVAIAEMLGKELGVEIEHRELEK